MKNAYTKYKEFRNFIKKFELLDSLYHVWIFAENLEGNQPLRKGFIPLANYGLKENLKGIVFPWDLETLTKEIIIHADFQKKRSFSEWESFSKAINFIREIDDSISASQLNDSNILLEVNRLLHKQIPWQKSLNKFSIMRYSIIYESPQMREIIESVYGITWQKIFTIFMAWHSIFQQKARVTKKLEISKLGISQEDVDSFLRYVCTDFKTLKSEISSNNTLDENWAYKFNPLIQRPLISIPSNEDVIICPLPQLLWSRVSQGLYFDIVNERGFSQAYGDACEAYVGSVASRTLNTSKHDIVKPEKYIDAKSVKHGADWIISDETANLFIETKAKKLRFNSKFLLNAEELTNDIDTMCSFIVQNYKNILDAKNGKTNWKENNLPTFSIVVTMEDWQIFSPILQDKIQTSVEEKLKKDTLPTGLLETIPYIICSAEEFELLCRVIAEAPLHEILKEYTTNAKFKGWLLRSFLLEKYKEEIQSNSNFIFKEEWENLVSLKMPYSNSM